MVKILERALAEVASLPEAAQEKIGKELLAHVEKLRGLRESINRSIERGGSYTDEEGCWASPITRGFRLCVR